ncbi:N-alpha-acetyltransferase 40 isoform X3 [Hydra vulgaris]|uniref:N-alpha-acetyltransferase 40 n=1 Tax=Hydra vulgaris TaxID=6087 RepID=A0ABM4CHG4_HYDVU
MGKKSEKGKEKKLKRQQGIQTLNNAVLAVLEAEKIENPLDALTAFHKYRRNGLDLTIICKKISAMESHEIDFAFEIVKDNMMALYKQSSWGWSEKKKREEMQEQNARYLLVKDEEENFLGMAHFRFDVDNDIEVLYCYEIQLDDQIRGKGVGKFLMQILELIAIKNKMKKIVLTVFKDNLKGKHFFEKLKYTSDDTSPQFYDPHHPENYDYEIYSKHFVRK